MPRKISIKKIKTKPKPKKSAPAKPRKKAPKKSARWPLVALTAVFLTLAAAIFAIWCVFISSVVPENTTYTIVPGASVSGVARDLGLNGAYKFAVRQFGNRVMAGTYDFPAGTGVWRLAEMTARGEVASTSITVPEGLTVRQIADMLNDNELLFGKITNHYRDGELFPDTYIIAKGTNRQAAVDLMARKMTQIRFQLTDRAFSPPAPLKDWDEVITLASIVQKETPRVSEMPTVASVYLNRLRKRMRLQADPTVVYVITGGLGDMRGRPLYSKHLWTESPYNTYRNAGLPPAPIANPGLDAIKAVLNPAETNFYYFVADGEGGHNFSETLDEHNRHRAKWQEIKKSLQ